MPTELEFTKLEDPFLHLSSFSLIPKTLVAHSSSSRIETIEDLFKSLVAKGSPKMMQQAQIIANSFGDIDDLCKEDENIDANFRDRGKERPALGRKRARFSIKPDVPSFPKPDTNISSSFDDIDDPDEYFKAFEQEQNADRELQKLRGGALMDVTQQDLGTKTRQRRPGLLGKRPSYRHRISEDDAMADTLGKSHYDDVLNCSTSLINSESVDSPVPQVNNTNRKLQEAELEDSVLENEKSMLDDLISHCKDHDEDEDETFLRDILHLKPIDVGELQVPGLPNIHFSQHSAPKGTSHAQLEHINKSSSSARSPLVPLSALRNQVSRKNLLDRMNSSFHTEDSSPDSSMSKSAGKKSLTSDKLEGEDDLYYPAVETDRGVELLDSHSRGDLQEGDYMQHDPFIFDEPEAEFRCHDSQPKTQVVLEDAPHSTGENANDDFNAKESCPAEVSILTSQQQENPHNVPDKEHALVPPPSEASKQKAPKRKPNKKKYSRKENATENVCPPEEATDFTDLPDNNTKDEALVPRRYALREQKASIVAPSKRKNNRKKNVASDGANMPSENQQVLNNENEVAATRRMSRKGNSMRQSLAGAGTVWEAGKRKSSRHRFRPLEHWNGERLLFGRIHNSLATVIGAKKYASPGNESFKIESYVADEFAALVAKAASQYEI